VAKFCGESVVIADIDFGFLITHQYFVPNLDLEHAYNGCDGSNNICAGANTDHGTAVMGLAGAASNAEGRTGFCLRCDFMADSGKLARE
jgi:hypothetical protein